MNLIRGGDRLRFTLYTENGDRFESGSIHVTEIYPMYLVTPIEQSEANTQLTRLCQFGQVSDLQLNTAVQSTDDTLSSISNVCYTHIFPNVKCSNLKSELVKNFADACCNDSTLRIWDGGL